MTIYENIAKKKQLGLQRAISTSYPGYNSPIIHIHPTKKNAKNPRRFPQDFPPGGLPRHDDAMVHRVRHEDRGAMHRDAYVDTQRLIRGRG